MLGRWPLDGRDDGASRGVSLEVAAADDVQFDATAAETAELVERGGQVPGEAVDVVDHDRAGSGHLHPLG